MRGLDDGPDGLNDAAWEGALGLRPRRRRRRRPQKQVAAATTTTQPLSATELSPHHCYFDAFASVSAIGADLVLDEAFQPGAADALAAWAAERGKVVEHREVTGWAGMLTVRFQAGTASERSIDVYLR